MQKCDRMGKKQEEMLTVHVLGEQQQQQHVLSPGI